MTRSHCSPDKSVHSIRPGFSLIELLVVIAIISLLVSILLPSLNRAKDLARTVTCASQVRSLGIGMTLYLQENGHVFPRSKHKHIEWYEHLRDDYLGSEDGYFFCPADESVNPDEPVDRLTPNISVGANESGPVAGPWYHNVAFGELDDPGAMVLMADSAGDITAHWRYVVSGIWDARYYPASRHDGGANIVFCDGHVGQLTFDQMVWDGTVQSRDRYHDLWWIAQDYDPDGGW